MQYLDDLKARLTELAEITEKLSALENQKDIIRSQIDKWLKINDLETFEGYDNNNQIWKIWRASQTRNSITDYTMLREILGDENSHLISNKEINILNIRKAKKFSDEWLAK